MARDYPGSEYAAKARRTADALRTMVAEDRAHAAVPPDQLPIKERVDELIFRLRDQQGEQWSDPGSCEIFAWPVVAAHKNSPDTSPAGQLSALGTAAVPQLIAALDDPHFARAVGRWRSYTFSHYVLTVGDCAEQTLEHIAGQRFYQPRTTSSYLSKDGDVPAVRAAVEA